MTITDSAVLTASGRSICGDLQHGMTPPRSPPPTWAITA
ncbi:hypothetical protein I552_10247 [Mycobacterium xenopi 3993]|nr:hypothetical protein I552_10247 [Mycobacterium xenopi 3993]